jgi:thiol-disulfide isomerase/thioredoxin
MKRERSLLLTLLLFICLSGKGQNIQPISIGDQVPETVIPRLINSEKSTGNLADYKDRLLILDFWATTCSGCVEALPRMMSLQQEFGKQVTILPVTYENEELVLGFLKKNKLTKSLNVNSVVDDKALSALFKHQYIPHEVWIYKGKLIAATSSDYVDKNNIRKVLNGEIPKWPVKNDFYEHDYDKPLFFTEKSNWTNDDLMYTAISQYREGVETKIKTVYDSVGNIERTYFINCPILGIYTLSWHKLIDLPFSVARPNRYIFEVKDRSKYIQGQKNPYGAEWKRANNICFEMRHKGRLTEKERSARIIADLDHFFNLKGRWEKRKAKCLVLRKVDESKLLKTGSVGQVFEQKNQTLKIRNSSLSNFVYRMNNEETSLLMLNETNYVGKVDMDLDVSSLLEMKKGLSKYGLDLNEEEREEYFFVLTERK